MLAGHNHADVPLHLPRRHRCITKGNGRSTRPTGRGRYPPSTSPLWRGLPPQESPLEETPTATLTSSSTMQASPIRPIPDQRHHRATTTRPSRRPHPSTAQLPFTAPVPLSNRVRRMHMAPSMKPPHRPSLTRRSSTFTRCCYNTRRFSSSTHGTSTSCERPRILQCKLFPYS